MKEHPYRWAIVAVGALMTCVGFGSMFSLAVYLDPISTQTGWSRAGISGAMTIDFLVMGVSGFFWGFVSDRFGARIAVLCGAVLLGAGLVTASQAQSLLTFQIAYGAMIGVAAGSFFAPMIAATTGWFETRRSLAVSLVSAGLGVAPMTISPFAGWLIEHNDWRTTMMTIGVVAWCLLIPAAFLVRRPPTAQAAQAGAPAGQMEGQGGMTVVQALRSPQFLILAFTFFLCCAAHSGPIFHTMSYAMFCGIAPLAAVSIYSLEGLAGLGGRILLGLSGDRFGAKPVLIAGLLTQAFAIEMYQFVTQIEGFYALSIIFGAAYGGVMPLYAVLARGYFGQRIMGTVFGAATMISALGMAIGPLMGGMVFDAFHAYAWMYIIAGAFGVAAGTMALAFPPFARPNAAPQPA